MAGDKIRVMHYADTRCGGYGFDRDETEYVSYVTCLTCLRMLPTGTTLTSEQSERLSVAYKRRKPRRRLDDPPDLAHYAAEAAALKDIYCGQWVEHPMLTARYVEDLSRGRELSNITPTLDLVVDLQRTANMRYIKRGKGRKAS